VRNALGQEENAMRPEDLITYCGGYGGACARWGEYTVFRDLAAALAEWVDAQGCQYWMPREMKEFNYTEFRKGLDFFSKEDSWLVCRKCCRGGDGNPECEIRKCCEEKELDLCPECGDFPCEKVEGDAGLIERRKEYIRLGKDEWLRQQVEKAKLGFEGHTKKYYQIWAKEYPPKRMKTMR